MRDWPGYISDLRLELRQVCLVPGEVWLRARVQMVQVERVAAEVLEERVTAAWLLPLPLKAVGAPVLQ